MMVLRKIPKHERESRIIVDTNKSIRKLVISNGDDDYEAPAETQTLSPKSKWLIVRNNIHKIRSWGLIRRMSVVDQPFQDWYLFFQMRRELKRAEDQIRSIQYRSDFVPVHYFELPLGDARVQRYNVSHVKPSDGIYYAGLGSEPIVLQYLLYYFSKECPVPHNSIFYSFLSDVNSVLETNRKRINRIVVFRKLALILTLIISIILVIMLFSLILSVVTTISNLREMYKNDVDGSIRKNVRKISSFTARVYIQDDESTYDHDLDLHLHID